MSRLKEEMKIRGLPSSFKRNELVEKLRLIWPTTENNDKFTPCGFCKRTVTVKMLLNHAKECKKKDQRKLKTGAKYGPLPALFNKFDDAIQRW